MDMYVVRPEKEVVLCQCCGCHQWWVSIPCYFGFDFWELEKEIAAARLFSEYRESTGDVSLSNTV